MKDTRELGDIGSKCAWCGKVDGGPWSGLALFASMKYVHSKCERAWAKHNEKSRRAMNTLNDFFSKL